MTRSYKMLLIRAMQGTGVFPGSIGVDQLADAIAQIAKRNPTLRRDISADLSNQIELRRVIEKGPIDAWVEGRGFGKQGYFTYENRILSTAFDATGVQRQRLNDLVEEIVDWRLADYLGGDHSDTEVGAAEPTGDAFVEAAPTTTSGADLWREYMREEIPPLFGQNFSPGSWNQGFVVQGQDVFLLVTLNKDHLLADHRYEDRFIDPMRFHWQSQNRTTQGSAHGRIISGQSTEHRLHLFVRREKSGAKRRRRSCSAATSISIHGQAKNRSR
jgi:hypothetical protein